MLIPLQKKKTYVFQSTFFTFSATFFTSYPEIQTSMGTENIFFTFYTKGF